MKIQIVLLLGRTKFYEVGQYVYPKNRDHENNKTTKLGDDGVGIREKFVKAPFDKFSYISLE